jgi:dienelactone hydrolase
MTFLIERLARDRAAGRVKLASLIAILFCLIGPIAGAQQAPPYTEIFYKNGNLRLQAYLYKPTGRGPFPLIIYNHGSRAGAERAARPFPFIGQLLTNAGYAVLVPERRGYSKSDGVPYSEDLNHDVGPRFVQRMQDETGDVLAALDTLKTDPTIDAKRIAIMGWSLGGIVSVFAASRSDQFFAVVNQAGAALTWDRSPAIQSALTDAARKIRAPTLCLDAKNDATTAAVTRVCDAVHGQKVETELTIYPPFTPAQNPTNIAPGHIIFSAEGVSIWGADVVRFVDKHRPR